MNNIASYSTKDTVEYYRELSEKGLFNYEREVILKFFPTIGKVLDIGCGAGRTTTILRDLGYDVVGVDYSAKMIEAARTLSPNIQYEVQDVRKLNFLEGTFDYAIFSFNGLMLLETYEDRKQAILEIRRVLKEKGVFFFTTPFLDNKVSREYWAEKVQKYNKPLSQFSDKELLALGDDVIEEGDVEFRLHIPFLKEVRELLRLCGYDILFESRRLDEFSEEKLEDELDDNYLWVVIKKDV